MTVATRTTALEADPWATDAPPMAPAEQAPTEGSEAARLEVRSYKAEDADQAVMGLAAEVDRLDDTLAAWADQHLESLDYTGPAELIAWLQATKARLGVMEAYLARELGRTEGCPDLIVLPDGRHAEVVKGRDRKGWDHDAWKHDTRRAVLETRGVPSELIDPTTGMAVNVPDLLAAVQAVHGSAAPKVTALKPLGLAADDYCESFPGPYAVKVSTPSDATPTTTKD